MPSCARCLRAAVETAALIAVSIWVGSAVAARGESAERQRVTVYTLSGKTIELDLGQGYGAIEGLDPTGGVERAFVETVSGDLIEVAQPWRAPESLQRAAEIAGGMGQRLLLRGFIVVNAPKGPFPRVGELGTREGRCFRVADSLLVQVDPSTVPIGSSVVVTTSGDRVVLDPSKEGLESSQQFDTIAKLVGGWDKLNITAGGMVEEKYHVWRGAGVFTQGSVYRVVDGELAPLDASQPNTGHFVQTTFRAFIEVNPDLPMREQLDAIAPLVGGWKSFDMTGGWRTGEDEQQAPRERE